MNHDGWGFNGAGTSDKRLAGQDLQHSKQLSKGRGERINESSGGPMKEAIDQELNRHNKARELRLQHLKEHYER